MKKIKSVRLKKDYSTPYDYIQKGTELKKMGDNWLCYHEDIIATHPEFFDITFENDFFEVKPLESGFGLFSGGIMLCSFGGTTMFNYNRLATRQEAEFENMRRETLYYFRELARELNEGWEWKEFCDYQYLSLSRKGLRLSFGSEISRLETKFSMSVSIEQITERALPSMVENFIKICKSQY